MSPEWPIPADLASAAGRRDEWDLLVIANPVWEYSWILPELPPPGMADFDPDPTALATAADGGGSALNSACALACAGRRVVAVGRVGDDPEGHAAIAALGRRGIATRIEISRGRTTKRNHLYVERRGRRVAFRAFLPPGCAPAWSEETSEMERARVLLLDRLAAESPGWLRSRRARRLQNAFNRNSPATRASAIERFREAIRFIDYLQFPEGTRDLHTPADGTRNPADPETRQGIHAPPEPGPLTSDGVNAILRAGVQVLVRTRGPAGVIVHGAGDEPVAIPAIETDVVDPTGAGDAFAAGFLDALLDGTDIAAAARHGLDWSARACRHLGARGWLDIEPPERH